MSMFKTVTLMLVLSGLLLVAGAFFGGIPGIIMALVFSLLLNFVTYWFSDKLVLSMSHAHEVSENDDRELHQIVSEQATLARIPKPKVYVIQSDSPNAFATGRSPKHAAVAVTTGIQRLLTRQELGGVIAHELAHVGNRDTLIMTVAATMAGAIAMIATIAQWSMFFGGMGGGRDDRRGGSPVALIGLLVVIIVMPLVATLVRLAISRAREYQADATGARTSGQPFALADALEKLEAGAHQRPMKVNEGTAHLFIVNPLSAKSVGNMFSTHPPIAERAKRLRAMRSF
ncbi:MAG: zinc metalloprotease HtpX [Chloroflexota bacterium]|nr:zinc metalloprotease HtpX [Chloroflexota bacterium]